jgi:hypothetical protein
LEKCLTCPDKAFDFQFPFLLLMSETIVFGDHAPTEHMMMRPAQDPGACLALTSTLAPAAINGQQ